MSIDVRETLILYPVICDNKLEKLLDVNLGKTF